MEGRARRIVVQTQGEPVHRPFWRRQVVVVERGKPAFSWRLDARHTLICWDADFHMISSIDSYMTLYGKLHHGMVEVRRGRYEAGYRLRWLLIGS
jgi:hypothetical protein